MIYSNIRGTSETSFKIGPKGVALSSGAIINDPTSVLNGFKRVNVETDANHSSGLVYDIEIPQSFVTNVTVDQNDPNIYLLTIVDRYTGQPRVVTINAGLGATGVQFSGNGAKENNIATFSDTTGKTIKDSGFSVYTGEFSTGSENLTGEIPTVSNVYSYVGQLTDYLANRLNGERLEGNS